MIHPAAFSELLKNGQVACHLCPAECRLSVGKHGNCASRSNQNNVLISPPISPQDYPPICPKIMQKKSLLAKRRVP